MFLVRAAAALAAAADAVAEMNVGTILFRAIILPFSSFGCTIIGKIIMVSAGLIVKFRWLVSIHNIS